MEALLFIFGFGLGVINTLILKDKSININIKTDNKTEHKNEMVQVDMPNLVEAMTNTTPEDDIYEKMGMTSLMRDIEDMVNGGDINGK